MPKHDNPNSENQENLLMKSTSNYNEENLLLNMKNGNKATVMTPNGGAKNVLTNRKVLAEKTPGNAKRPLASITSPSGPSTASPSLLSNSLKTPLAHPSLRDIAASNKALSNPPDLFLQPSQKRRSVRNRKEIEDTNVHVHNKDKDGDNVTEIPLTATTKLVTVFPSTSDELDAEEVEIEHAASTIQQTDSDSFLFGTSKIIPNLVLHENIDFSALIDGDTENTNVAENTVNSTLECEEINEKELESKLAIEPIIVEFKLDQ